VGVARADRDRVVHRRHRARPGRARGGVLGPGARAVAPARPGDAGGPLGRRDPWTAVHLARIAAVRGAADEARGLLERVRYRTPMLPSALAEVRARL
jgi:hypothetical protein